MASGWSVASRRKNLTCGVCQQVYDRPKLLPCLHTFCLPCVKELVKTQGPQSFKCPVPECQQTIKVPENGAEYFADNHYISDVDLQQERRPMAVCQRHGEALKYFCLACELPACLSCKLTKHEGHSSEDLSEVADRCKEKLATRRKRLDSSVREMKQITTLAHNNLEAARRKTAILREQANFEFEMLVLKAAKLRDKVLEGLDIVAENVEKELKADVESCQETYDRLVGFQQRVDCSCSGNAIDTEVIATEREMRVGIGCKKALDALTAEFQPRDTPRLVLHSLARSVKETLERDLLLYLGFPKKVLVPCSMRAFRHGRELVSLFYRCTDCSGEHIGREVHALFRTDDDSLYVAFGGRPPTYDTERIVQLDKEGGKMNAFEVNRKITFDKSVRTTMCIPEPENCVEIMEANSNGSFRMVVDKLSTTKITIESKKPCPQPGGVENVHRRSVVSFTINSAARPRGFDVNASGDYFVIISEEAEDTARERDNELTASGNFRHRDEQELRKDKENVAVVHRQLRLYRKNLSDPISIYNPPSSIRNFQPSAVTFWKPPPEYWLLAESIDQPKELLLIADWLNDYIHVTSVENRQFSFIRFLQPGSGDIVRPTALEIDNGGIIWIGCETGSVLQCRFYPEGEQLSNKKADQRSQDRANSNSTNEQLTVVNESLKTSVSSD